MQNPFDRFDEPAQADPFAPRRVAPVIAPPKPGQNVDLQRDVVGLQADQARLLREQAEFNQKQEEFRKKQRANDLISLEAAGTITDDQRAELEALRGQGVALPKKSTVTESERTAGFLGANVGTAFLELQEIAARNPEALKPYIGAQILGGDKGFAGNAYNDPDRRQASGAQDLLLDSALTLGTGAAYNKEQFENYRAAYLPQPFDDDATVEAKSRRMRALLNNARLKAGGSAEDIDRAMTAFGFGTPKSEKKVEKPITPSNLVDVAVGDDNAPTTIDISGPNLSGLSAEAQAQFKSLQADPNVTGDQLRDFLDRNAPGWDLGADKPKFDQPLATERGKNGVVENVDAIVRGAADVPTLGLADEIAAAGDTLFGRGGTFAENLRRQRAVDRYDEQNNPIARFSGQIGGSLLLPTRIGAANVGARDTALAAGETPDLAALAGARAATRRGAIEGGLYGAGYGFGSGETLRDRAIGSATGGLAGAGLGYGFGKLSELYTRRRGGLPGEGQDAPPAGGDPNFPGGGGDVLDVAGRVGVNRPTPSAVGGRAALATENGLAAAPGSLPRVAAAREAEADALGRFAGETAARLGNVAPDRAAAGEMLARGANVADRAAARAAGREYQARDAMMGGSNAPVTMGGTQAALANIGSDFGSNDAVRDLLTHPLIRRLENAEAGELTLGESTELLSEARRVLRQARKSEAPGRLIGQLQTLESAIESDVMRAAQASDAIAGRAADEGAAAAMTNADRMWAERMRARKAELGKAMEALNEGKSASVEDVYEQMLSDMKRSGGNMTRFNRMMGRLPQRARDAFSATLFDELGRARSGAQNAAGDVWSPETFMTNWNNLSDVAKRRAFGGRGVDREIGDILRYAERLRDVNRARNTSNTAPTAAQASYLTAIGYSLVSGKILEAAKVATLYPGMAAVSRAFLSVPAARQWLRSALAAEVRGNDSQVQTLARRLPALAARNPQIANEIGILEQSILRGANDNISGAGRVAAQPEGAPEDK